MENNITIFTDQLEKGNPIDAVEIHPCCVQEMEFNKQCVVQCEPDEAGFWSVYLHHTDGQLACVADAVTIDAALALKTLLDTVAHDAVKGKEYKLAVSN